MGEGTHFIIPWVQRPIIFDARTQPNIITTVTGRFAQRRRSAMRAGPVLAASRAEGPPQCAHCIAHIGATEWQ